MPVSCAMLYHRTQYFFPLPVVSKLVFILMMMTGGNAVKYYLVDVRFTKYQYFMEAYRGTRYHLAEYRGHDGRYRILHDLFNHARLRLCNVIEGFFGVLKELFQYCSGGCRATLMSTMST
ncbi:UNVERIFIED_CONTAM: hypothetical protein Sradi_4017200 [Sesamum radiatum]|uniref:DDE Tnp4 domain-containing protein n=1 Tax=Sesamum radiatum TaxID=300843 RepID=A0AAW2PKW3_SESRA